MSTNVCLVMIVKDEQPVIGRALRSVAPVIDEAVIVDTGSADPNSMYRACAEALNLPLQFLSHAWVDFAHNRTGAVRAAQARSQCDYLLMHDADDMLYTPPGQGFGPEFTGDRDLYTIDIDYAGLRYARMALFRRALEWRYVCPVHEVLLGPEGHTCGHIGAAVIIPEGDGARSRDPVSKFQRDIRMLSQDYSLRGQYYLAQSYRDLFRVLPPEHTRQRLQALLHARNIYAARACQGGWEEEVFSAKLEEAKCLEHLYWLQGPRDDVGATRVLDAYFDARSLRATRAEPLWHAMRFARAVGHGQIADILEPTWASIPLPADQLFVERHCYS